ncbi:MAG: hypothetical protein ACXQS2_05780 [Methermicoccaceae archaeon]
MAEYGLTAEPDPDDPRRTLVRVDFGRVDIRKGELIYTISPDEEERRKMALEVLRQQYVKEGFDVVLDEESGLDMSVVVGEFENTASYYVVGEKVRVEW